MAEVNKDTEMNTNPETEVSVELDPIAELSADVEALKEAVNAINEKLDGSEHEKTEETNSKWTTEEKAEAAVKNDPISPEALDKAVSYGLPFSLFGFAVVFTVLAVIMFVVTIFGKILGSAQDKPKAEKKTEKKPEPKKQSPVAQETPAAPVEVAPVADEKGIVAAIIAAISAFRSANGESAGGFRVVSFKKRK